MEIYSIDYNDLSTEEQERVKETIKDRDENRLISLEVINKLFI